VTSEIAHLPKGWVRTNLTAIAEIIRGVSFPKDQKSSLPQEGFLGCLRTTNVQREVEWNNMLFVPRRFIRRQEQLVRLNDILISTANSLELVGKVALIRAVPFVTTIGAFIAIIRVHPDINPKFVYFQIASSDIQSYFRQRASTTTNISNISTSNVLNSFLGIPPLPEQRRVVAKIEELFTRLDAGVEALKNIKTQLKRYRQSVLKHAFEGKLTAEWRHVHKNELEPASVLLDRIKQERQKSAKGKYKELLPLDTSDLPKLPGGWAWARAGEVYDIVGGGTPSTAIAEYWQGDTPWITSADIFGLTDIRPRRQITRQAIENSATNLVPAGSLIVVTRVGLGKIALTKAPVCFSQDSQALVAGNTSLFPDYSLYCLSEAVQVFRYKHRGTTINGVTKKQLAELPFVVPPLTEQHCIVEEIERRFSVADEIEKTVDHSLKQAERLRQSVLKRTFAGKLVPQDPNDEPAEKLLERIKAERAKHLTETKAASKSKKRTHTKQMRLV
jgi:type I restriction enzyme, S subunit